MRDEAGLSFLSLQWESYDLCDPIGFENDPRLQHLIATIRAGRFQQLIADLPGYDVTNIGELASC